MMREKTKLGIMDHVCNLKTTDKYLLLGDSHVERLVWKFPHLALANTWLCGIGGDRAFQLSYRINNDTACGYTQHRRVQNDFESILILIGTNDLTRSTMTKENILKVVEHVEMTYTHLAKRWPNARISVLPTLPVSATKKELHKENFKIFNQTLAMSGMMKCDAAFEWELDVNEDFEDDIHLNESGYKKFTNQIIKEF